MPGPWIETPRSSSIAAVRYDATDRVLEVRFKDGREYQYQPFEPNQHAEFMTAESMGRWLARFRGRQVATIAGPAERRQLQTHDPCACCGSLLDRALAAGQLDVADSWTCPKCGEAWRPAMVGVVRHWTMHAAYLVMRPGRRPVLGGG
jgi:hypothetical protein